MPRTASFKTIPYPAIGESYASQSRPVSAQRTVNLIPEVIKGNTGVTSTCLHHFSGLKSYVSGAGGEYDRGIHVFNNKLYQVAGGAFYLVTASGVRTTFGSIAGTGQVSMSDNGTTMLIVTGGQEYTFDGTTLTPTTITGANSPTNVEFLNGQFWYDGNDGSVGVSNVGGTTVNGYITPESESDPLVRTYIFNQNIYMFGSSSIEPWQYQANLTPPASRINQGIVESVGLSSRVGVGNTEKALYFVSNQGEAKQMQAFQPVTISTPAISNSWANYTLSDARVETFKEQSLDIVIFSFPTDGKTWAYVEQYEFWLELTDGTATEQRWLGNSIRNVYGKNVVADYNSGNIYELDRDTYTNNNNAVLRERIFSPLAGEKLGKPRQLYQMSGFRVGCETGVGNANEENPRLMISFSTDGGRSFTNEVFKDMGQEGQYTDIETYSNRHFRDLDARIRYAENTKFTLWSSSIDIREAGK